MVKHPGEKHEYKSEFEKMHMYAIKDRAALLRNLDYKAADVKRMIRQNVEWEYEAEKLPEYYSHIDQIVDYVFKQ